MTLIEATRWLLDPVRRKRTLAAMTVAILIAALGIAWVSHRHAQEARVERDVAQAGEKVLTQARHADEAAVGEMQASHDAIRMEEETNRAKTEAALSAHPDWSDQPVPDDVLGSLRD